MRVSKNRIYPYPIYSELTEDYINNDFALDAEIDYDSEIAILKLDVSISDIKIRELIENRLVGLYCHIECSATKYRKLFELSINNDSDIYNIEIPLCKLNGAIEVMCVLVAKENICSFDDDNLSEMFEGETIIFPQYGTIGYTDTVELTIIKRLDINGDIPSIFSIIADEESVEIQVEYECEQITIYIPKNEYEIYQNYKGTGVRLKQMMVIIPVLIEVLDYIKSDENIYENYPWYFVLEEAVKKRGYSGFSDESFKNASSLIIAQNILGDIAKEAFDEFDYMNRESDD